jgi:putative membrane protein
MFQTLPLYLTFLGACLGLLVCAMAIYTLITPYREISLIRQGNVAASISLGGTAIGMTLPLAAVASGTYSVAELVLWGGVALLSQLAVFALVCLKLPGFRAGIEADKLGYGVTLGTFSVAMGILNAGALSV